MTILWLVRHGQTDWNLQARWQGQAPDAPGLNETGFAQARSARDQLKDVSFDAVYSSPILRSRQTAELVAEPHGLTIIFEPRLREINLGIWEGMLSTDIEAKYPQEMERRAHDPFHSHAPQGESISEVAERVVAATDEIAKKHVNQSVLVVAHGVSLAVIFCKANGIPLQKVYEHIPENAKPNRVEWGN